MKGTATIFVVAAMLTCTACASSQTTSTTTTTPVGTVGSGPVEVDESTRGVLPVGHEIDVRLQETLSSKTAKVEQRFAATTVVNLEQDGRVLVPAGSSVRGFVSSVSAAGNIDRTGNMTLAFDELMVNGREYPLRAMATGAFESGGVREEAGTLGTAGAVGAVVGGIIGGLKGAIIGAVVGAGGVIAATEGKDVELPAGSIIRIRLDSSVRVR